MSVVLIGVVSLGALGAPNIIKGVFVDATTGAYKGKVVYVATNGVDSATGLDGWVNAKQTIQAGLDAAAAGDTVLVGPGVYDTAGTPSSDGASTPTVVHITKKIYLKSSEGKAKTIIRGTWDATETGIGPNARRCVFIGSNGAGAVVDGFTLSHGATLANVGGNDSKSCGGGIVAWDDGGQNDAKGITSNVRGWLVNSTVEDCRANHGAAVGRGIVPLNCLFRRNIGFDGNSSCFYRCYDAYNCIFENNGDGTGCVLPRACGCCAVNCTFLLNQDETHVGAASTERGRAFNCAFIGNVKPEGNINPALYFPSNCVTSASTGRNTLADRNCKGGVSPYQYASPLTEDYHLVGGGLVDCGDTNLLTTCDFIPEEFQAVDFYGNPRVVGGQIDVGAVERQPTDEPSTGFIALGDTNLVLTIGEQTYRTQTPGTWFAYTCNSDAIRVAVADATVDLFGYEVKGNDAAWTVFQYPDRAADQGFYLAPMDGTRCSNVLITAKLATSVKWADPNLSDYSAADGSKDRPYETLQAAVNASAGYGVVYAKPGVYDTGTTIAPIDQANDGQDTNSTPNRVYIDRHLRVVSTAGAESTIIKGAHATGANSYTGCGVGAVRCVLARIGYDIAVQGFTLTGGATDGDLAHRGRWDMKDGQPRFNSSDSPSRGNFCGGAFRATNWRTSARPERGVITDCVVSNNFAYYGGAVYGGTAQRCVFTGNGVAKGDAGCTASSRGALFYVTLRGCLVYGNQTLVTGAAVEQVCHLRFSTVLNDVVDSSCVTYVSSLTPNTNPTAAVACIDPAHGDWRVRAGSSAVSVPWGEETDLVKYSTSDIHGNPPMLNAITGRGVAGCEQIPAPVVTFVSPFADDLSRSDSVLATPGESFTVTRGAEVKRPLLGWIAGGVTNASTELSFTFTVPATPSLEAFVVGPAYQSNVDWYVNPTAADDEANGWTSGTPKRTLAGAMAWVLAGDTVHAAPGTYEEKTMVNAVHVINSDDPIPARVVVPSGVTLVADEGAEATIIKGEYATVGEMAARYGCGDDSVRGVCLMAGAVLRGFTVTRASTRPGAGQPLEYCAGGCVAAPSAKDGLAGTALIEDCVLTYGAARNGPAVYGGVVRRCRIGTHTLMSDGITHSSILENCLLVQNTGASMLRSHYGVHNCTLVLDDAWGDPDFTLGNAQATIDNTILYYKKFTKDTTLRNAHNCIIHSWDKLTVDASCSNITINNDVTTFLDTATWKPLKGGDAVDAGDNARIVGEVDLAGEQRVYNGMVDIGCYEYDWRPDFAATLGLKRLTVTTATPQVLAAENAVEVRDGELAGTLSGCGGSAVATLQVVGGGTLEFKMDDEVVQSFTSADGAVDYRFTVPNDGKDHALSFVYAAVDGDAAGAFVRGLAMNNGTVLYFR